MAKIYYCERIQSKVREKEKPQGSGGRRCELPRSCHCLLQAASAARPGCSAPCNSRAMRIKHLSLTGALCCHPLPQWQSWNWLNIPPGTTSAFLKNLEDVWVCTLAKRDDDSDGNGALCWSASRNDRQRKQARVSCEALWGKCPLRGKQQMKGELNCSHHRLPFSFTQPPSCPNNHLTFSGYVSVPAEKGPHLTPLRAHRLEKTESHRRKHTLEAQRCRDSSQVLETLGSAVSPGCSGGSTPSASFSRSSSNPGGAAVPSPQACREDWHRHEACGRHLRRGPARVLCHPCPVLITIEGTARAWGTHTERSRQDAVFPDNEARAVLSSEVPAAPPTRTSAQPLEERDRVRPGRRDAKGTRGPGAGNLQRETKRSPSRSPGHAHGALGTGAHVSSPSTARIKKRDEISFSLLNNRIKASGWTDRETTLGSKKSRKKGRWAVSGQSKFKPRIDHSLDHLSIPSNLASPRFWA